MKKGNQVGIVCCSNGQLVTYQPKIRELIEVLDEIGLIARCSPHIYQKDNVFSGTGKERADALMAFYNNPEIKAIFDISGGDIANEVLPYLDFEGIKNSDKTFWGYSDLTTLINAIYTKTGKSSVLYQVRNLIYRDGAVQIQNFKNTVIEEKNGLYDFDYNFIQGEHLEGVVVGGNIRCLLKLAGTPYWPDMKGKVLLLEARGGIVPQMTTYLSQLQQIGVFKDISGLLLGTFTEMEEQQASPNIVELIKQYSGETLPIVKTSEIGHGTDSKGIIIGGQIRLSDH